MQLSRRARTRLAFGLFGVAVAACGMWWLMIRMPLKSFRGTFLPLTGEQIELQNLLRRHINKFSREIGERNLRKPAQLEAAANYVETVLADSGRKVQSQHYTVDGVNCRNLDCEIPGSTHPGEIILVGAHYDSADTSPGANDNGTGIAALLAMASSPALQKPARTLRFVAFVNEEPPFFKTEQMGSLVYSRRCRERGEKISAMLCVDTIGYFNPARGTQKYPFPMGLFYPSTGDFVAFVGRTRDGALVRRCIETFRREAQFPSEGAALPGWLPGISWSDHWSFWQTDYPSLLVTDTAPFRFQHYHTPQDATDKIDFDAFTRVVSGLEKIVADLCNR